MYHADKDRTLSATDVQCELLHKGWLVRMVLLVTVRVKMWMYVMMMIVCMEVQVKCAAP